MLLAGCGFAVPKRAAAALAALAACVDDVEALAGVLPALLDDLAASPDPDAALDGISNLLGAMETGQGELLRRLADDADKRRVLLGLLSSSRSFAAALARYPHWVEEVLAPGEIDAAHSREALSHELRQMLSAATDRAGRLAQLRGFRRRHILGIAARDVAGRADLAATTAEISAVAEVVIAAGLQLAAEETGVGEPRLAVLALGKLGGEELNYSSDIDLIFVGRDAGGKTLAVAEELVRQLSEPTPEGVAYRVDMRLRPEGSGGALVAELESALNYYRTRARPWERQALIKCRPVAGDTELSASFMAGIESFIWQEGVSPAQVARACQLRLQMEKAAGQSDAVEVKSGAGGIRDVEFAVQILQLAYGADYPCLRVTGTLKALEALESCGVLESSKARSLRSGYEFLRRVEHCLQTMDELALHAVPVDALQRAALARRLGYGGSPESARAEFESDLEHHAGTLRAIYAEVCGQGASGDDLAAKLCGLFEADAKSELVSLLSVLGFGGGRRSAKALRSLAERSAAPCALLAAVLERLRSGPSPDRGLANLDAIADENMLRRISADAELREAVLGVAERSDFLVELLVARGESISSLVRGDGGRARRGRERLAAEFAEFTAEAEAVAEGGDRLAESIKEFRAGELLRVGARDLLDGESPEEVSAELTYLAELAISKSLACAGVESGVVVLALGRLGGREMSYGSDLDLVFVNATGAESAGAAVPEATRILTAAGYEVDTRLRPAGASGQLVASLDGYRAYRDGGQLAVWERLALVRARAIAGSDEARRSVEDFLTETLYGNEAPADLAEQTWEMRLKLERTAGERDFKRGPGGLVDLEFLAEYLALAHGVRQPQLRSLTTEDTFDAAAEVGILPRPEAAKAIDAHRFLRRLEMRARVLVGRPVRALPSDAAELGRLARMMDLDAQPGVTPSEALRANFERHTTAARKLLERVIGP
jgi:[glutamine synthetase] adenylyltransferase / [glutamine synthetase]-adenylyl-L-tyrosine phosphorylase